MGRYLDDLKILESGGVPHLQNLQNPQNPTSVGFVGTPPPRFEKSQSPPTHQAEARVTIEQLPERLVTAATRVCTELWNDDEEAVQTMMEDLCWHDPQDWPDLIQHFERQLPPPPPKAIPPMVTCSGCNHAAPSPHHPGIIHCKASVESGAATGGWFYMDRHFCERREVQL